MSGVVPTAPEQPTDETENQIKSPDPRPDAPPDYNSHFVPGPAGPAVPAPASYPGGLPVGYYSPQQPCAFPSYQLPGGIHPIQYQPGKYHMPNQPVPITWMPGPVLMPNCPPGLEYLTQLDNIHVLQHFEPLEMMTSFETNNRYDIKNNLDQMVYIVTEDTDDFTRNAYRTLRPFVLRVTDCMGREIMTMQRPFRCTCCCLCCPSTRQELEVQCPPGVPIGFVAEHWNLCRAVYSLRNEKKENVMRVRGPCSTYGCGSDSVFEVKSLDGVSNIGSIIRKWNGLLSAMGNADHFEIHFPLDLDVKMKAMIFGACFLIDFMYFERSPSQHSSR
ncbi:phospholipid scramblase 4 [Phoca vitulina]|uniref:phospholipid scramblase 4 n=1 Tax=Phoca vitulina TaxID=9720 RepID=UPI0013961A33|nr:phospholipid scramblase 4 [Phoca vitulina]XP_032264399.1 phospholipid scramblase 4 [Phoca vitulina]XP_032264400.1 phospholipid scramblase 4 [Phoca vitulina]XP_032264401.1 phospholipid scramblase 4 [Phoca vitulina]XP_032264402.1 phospholipid scramblase 4 [Phoca vitulina]XP_032264403.1 phospholipid scramblase 4 [Phoca vitulina]XP_032264404.1 phospholipid scramblase 4 [Phoca vitulina]